jgi:hypothetical protein
MNRKTFGFLIILCLLLAPAALAQREIRCESDYGRRHVCSFDGWGRVALSRQLSKTACIEGRTWGRDGHNAVWVSNGCRADFIIEREERREHRRSTVVCESDRDDRHFCEADTSRGITLTRQLSRRDCVLNRTWGYNSRGIWVSHGCRAEFTLGR